MRSHKALFVYPECPRTFWGFHGALPYLGREVKAAFPPSGIPTISPMFPPNWRKRVVDMNIEPLTKEAIQESDFVFVSGMLIQLKSINNVISRCKALGKTVIGGGPAFTTSPKKFPLVDHVLRGEAENVLPKLLSDLESGRAEPQYVRTVFPDLHKTPIPDWGLFKDKLTKYASMVVQYSRGCPFKCEFCDVRKIFGERVRTKSPEQIIAELQLFRDLGWRQGSVFIADDNFIGNKKAAVELLVALIEWQSDRDYPFKLFGQVSINLGRDKQLMRLMTDAGFHQVFVGIETPDTKALRTCQKHQNVECNLVECVRNIQRNGMKVMGGFIVGLDGNTPAIFQDTLEFIEKTGIPWAMVGPPISLPGTDFETRLRKEGRLLKGYDEWDNTHADLNFESEMGNEILLRGYRWLEQVLYSPTAYYGRTKKMLFENYQPAMLGFKISRKDKLAFLRSLWKIGIVSKRRWLYWDLIFSTLRKKPELLREAIAQTIFGEHFIGFAERFRD